MTSAVKTIDQSIGRLRIPQERARIGQILRIPWLRCVPATPGRASASIAYRAWQRQSFDIDRRPIAYAMHLPRGRNRQRQTSIEVVVVRL